MITREQLADLQPGDVVEAKHRDWSEGSMLRGPVAEYGGTLRLCGYDIRAVTKSPAWSWGVVSRAPRQLYVNHPRTAPVAGDVAKGADGSEPSGHTWHYLGDEEFGHHWWRFDDRIKDCQPKLLRLLVDGETGQVVQ